jgi:hypothetical protein
MAVQYPSPERGLVHQLQSVPRALQAFWVCARLHWLWPLAVEESPAISRKENRILVFEI